MSQLKKFHCQKRFKRSCFYHNFLFTFFSFNSQKCCESFRAFFWALNSIKIFFHRIIKYFFSVAIFLIFEIWWGVNFSIMSSRMSSYLPKTSESCNVHVFRMKKNESEWKNSGQTIKLKYIYKKIIPYILTYKSTWTFISIFLVITCLLHSTH